MIYDINNNNTNNTYETIFRDKECCKIDGGMSYIYDSYDLNYDSNDKGYYSVYVNTGYVCTKSQGEFSDLSIQGGGCFISCQWRLANTNFDGTDFKKFNNSTVTLDDITWEYNKEKYLLFVTPKNNWGVVKNDGTYLSGPPEYKYTNEADSCFCDTTLTTPVLVVDPVTGKNGYGCKIKKEFLKMPLTDTKIIIDSSTSLSTSPYVSVRENLYNKSIKNVGCLNSAIINYIKN
jgi:hypothetical protein